MQVILHIGVHCTDEDRLLRTLLRNGDDLRRLGVAVPGPSRYRTLLSEGVNALDGSSAASGAREVLLDAMLSDDPENVSRLVLSHENLLGVPKLVLGGGRLYRKAERRVAMIRDLFAGDDVTLYLGLRNFATFLPAVLKTTPHGTLEALLNGTDPMHLRWSDLVHRLRVEVPEVPITLWCNEDTPLIWAQILREMAGLPVDSPLTGAYDLFSEIIAPEGMARFRTFLEEHPNAREAQKRRAMIAFLEKYALAEAMQEELDLPGWDTAYVDRLTELYDADLDRLAAMDGVRVIAP